MEGFLGAIKNMVHNYKKQDGTKLRPARSCRDLKIDHPEKKDGTMTILLDFLSLIKTQ